MTPASGNGPVRPWLRWVVSLLLGLGIVAAVWPVMAAMPADPAVDPWVVLGYLVALIPFHVLRALRWWPLLRSAQPVRGPDALALGLAGYMWIAALPLRLGELARPLLLRRRCNVPLGHGLGVVAVERITDGLMVGLLFFVGAWAGGATRSWALIAVAWTMGAFALALVALVLLAVAPPSVRRKSARAWRALPLGLGGRIARVVDEARVGLRGLAIAPVALFVLMTLLYWGWNVAAMTWFARQCGVPLSLAQGLMVAGAVNLVLVLPGGPGQLGVFQGGMALGLSLVVTPEVIADEGSRFTFWLYLCQLTTIALAGLGAQTWLGMPWDVVLRGGSETVSGPPGPPAANAESEQAPEGV